MHDDWTIAETRFDPATAKAYEGLFTLGSGYLHVRGSLEEHLADQPQDVAYERKAANVTSERFRQVLAQWGTYVPGVFGPHPTLNNEMVNLPWPLGLAPFVDGERLDCSRSNLLRSERVLSLRDGILRRTLTWATRSGATVTIRFERFVHAVRPHLIVQQMTVEADRPARLEVVASIDARVRTNGHDHFVAVRTAATPEGRLACDVTTDGGDSITLRSRQTANSTPLAASAASRERLAEATLCLDLHPGAPVTIERRTWVATSRDLDGGFSSADASLDAVAAVSSDQLLDEHRAEWAARWAACDVAIEGDEASQRAARLAIFHLLRCHVPDPRVAIDAKGYAGEAYWGRFFWDTEMYLLPPILYMSPDRADTLVAFRCETLAGARRNAARYGYPGARYAWESDHRGDECCPNWQYADHEVHVTADVAYGLVHHARGRGVELAASSRAVLAETARYWMERLTFDDRATLRGPRLLGVMGPDEYKPITNQNAYTNRLVAFALEAAAREGGPASDEERRRWATTAARIALPRDPSGQLVLQCDGFQHFAEPEFDRLWPDRAATFASQVPQERLYRSKCLKQADVLMLMALFPGEFSDQEVATAYDYYLPYTTHDSSLSAGAHCLVACRLGRHDDAWRFWLRGSRLDLPKQDGGEGGAAEGIHIAGAGATWQMLVLGFAGMRTALQAEEFTLAPGLPRGWRRLAFGVVWKGQPVQVAIEPHGVEVANRSDRPLAAIVHGQRRVIGPGSAEHFA